MVKEDVIHEIEEQQPDENMHPTQHANSETSDNIQVEILKLLQSMQDTLNNLKSNKCNHNNCNNNNKNRNKNRNSNNSNNSNNFNNFNSSNNSNNSNRRPFGNGMTDKYCWSHGACNHKSENYVYKDDGHKDNVTLENKISSSTRACTSS